MRRLFLSLCAMALAGGCRCAPVEPLRHVLPPGARVDAYQQQAASKVDVLWVVDNSGSMKPRQENLARNFQAFIELFSKGSIDFRMAVITTDIFEKDKTYRGSPRILSPSTPNLATAFAANVQVGITGSPYEAGLQAAQRVLERQAKENAPILDQIEECKKGCASKPEPVTCLDGCPEQYRVDFLSPGAYLYLIFVTDEEDRSSQDIRYYWRSFETAKGVGNDGTVTTAAIIGDVPTNGCGATPGARYLSLSQLTGGEVGSICDREFATTLRKLATNAVGLKRKFALGRKPNVETLQVSLRYPCNVTEDVLKPCAAVDRTGCKDAPAESVNLVCTPQQGGPDGWAYEPASQVIFFSGESVPGLNAQIEIQYFEEGKS